jgi:hypothetical protein
MFASKEKMNCPAASCGVSRIQNTEFRSQEKRVWMLDSGSWIPETKC